MSNEWVLLELLVVLALLVGLGIYLFLRALDFLVAFEEFRRQGEREAAYLRDLYTGCDSPASDPLDYVDDLPFVGVAHADRPTARYARACAARNAAGEGGGGEPPARPDDRLDGCRDAHGYLDVLAMSPADEARFYGDDQ